MAWLCESRLRSTDVADSSLLSTITLTLPSAEDIVSVTGVLFNGQPVAEEYVVYAMFCWQRLRIKLTR